MGERRGVYRVLVGKHEGKRQLGRARRRWRITLRWIFRKWDVGIWTGSSWLWMWHASVNALINFRVP
jgi:hypothetical protein